MKQRKMFLLVVALIFNIHCFTQNSDFSICSFNIRIQSEKDKHNQWKFRKDSVIKMLNDYQFDVICFQEDTKNYHLYDFKELTNYSFEGHRGEEKEENEWCSVYYNKNKFTMLDFGCFWLSETPDVPYSKGWDTKYARSCTWVKLKDKMKGKTVYVFNTHMDHKGIDARTYGAKVISEKVKEIAGNDLAFITGDMNSDPNSEAVKNFKESLFDTRALAKKKTGPDGTFHWYGTQDPLIQVDFVFSNSDKITVEESITLTRTFKMDGYEMHTSDHYPVIVHANY